ncbi:MAG: glycosyltransferase family 2 protein [Holosporaceae bacterium]|jgi:alpha-1,3-rhamnosyltransferase|nr:glycosyltransferase family 2 protein [Holosporaceae bacterium]
MHTNDDLVSVIIPAYNHEMYVQSAIKSIINQTYQNLELIIVDDGSRDATWEKIDELKDECEKRFKRILFRKQKNSGTANVLDETLYIASGKYIYYIASDDVAHPRAIEILHKNIGNAGLIFPDIAWIDSDGKRFYLDEKYQKTFDVEKATYKTLHEYGLNEFWPDVDNDDFDFYCNLLDGNRINVGFLLLRQAAINAGGWNSDVIIEDYYMHLQVSKKYKIKRHREVLFYYRRHETNISKNLPYILEVAKRIFMNEKAYCCGNGYGKIWNKIYKERYYDSDSIHNKLKFIFFYVTNSIAELFRWIFR